VQRRLGAILLVVALAAPVSILAGSTAVAVRHPPHPCDLPRRDGETIQHHSRRLIACAVGAFGPIRGGATRAVCIAKRESGLVPTASSKTGQYLGLYQHAATYWPYRFDTYTRAGWDLSSSALSGRSNAIVTVRMVRAMGGWKHAGWPAKSC
jgi:hypothetical protein